MLYIPFFLFSQENLVPNGNFENQSYQGGNDPTNYYSGGNNKNRNEVKDTVKFIDKLC